MQAGAGGDGRAVPPEGTRPGRGTWTWRKREALRDAHLAATQRNETNDRNKKKSCLRGIYVPPKKRGV